MQMGEDTSPVPGLWPQLPRHESHMWWREGLCSAVWPCPSQSVWEGSTGWGRLGLLGLEEKGKERRGDV